MKTSDRSPERLTIQLDRKRKNYAVKQATFSARHLRREYQWTFDVKADGEDDVPSITTAYIAYPVSRIEDLPGCVLRIPCGYDPEAEEYLATVYHYEHFDLDDNVVRFLDRAGRFFRVHWRARSPDLAAYMGAEKCSITIDATLRFEGMEEVPERSTRILLVDPFDTRDVLRQFLDGNGYETDAVAAPEHVLSQVTRNPSAFDLVLSVFLPLPEERRLVQGLRESGFAGRVLLACGHREQRQIAKDRKLGVRFIEAADGLDFGDLLATLQEYTERA